MRTTTVNASGVKLTIDTTHEKFGDAITIAHLAQFSFVGLDSDHLTIYEAQALLQRDWDWEIEPGSVEMEYGLSVHAKFKDGSALSVSAWGRCCTGNGYCPQCWHGITRFSPHQLVET
jgi:hypothetical protein